jgi:hypothetical protein
MNLSNCNKPYNKNKNNCFNSPINPKKKLINNPSNLISNQHQPLQYQN